MPFKAVLIFFTSFNMMIIYLAIADISSAISPSLFLIEYKNCNGLFSSISFAKDSRRDRSGRQVVFISITPLFSTHLSFR